ncbi:MAG TPA: M48 family metallopeptidase [Candidatus Kapabacteria bacterium]|nr:M48 family metallopeptidase [Candidatus Kapabacteria bacterium]
MPSTEQQSLASRIILSIVLMIGFYTLALAMASGLLYVLYAMVASGHFSLQIALVCIVGAVTILAAIVPRVDRFQPPGPELLPDKHPRLFALIRDVASAAGQEMPENVYLVASVNAAVTNRGGMMGIGSRRVMILGLGLLSALDEEQVRGVIAHEFGHFHAGDTKLGPWIYKTKSTIIRTVHALGRRSWLQRPFVWYGNAYLRITHAISRRQEFAADALAAGLIGRATMIEGLKRTEIAAVAFDTYWNSELAPTFGRGYRPAIAEGFKLFMAAEPVVSSAATLLADRMKHQLADRYDTHPTLSERIAALSTGEASEPPREAPLALGLLDNLDVMEYDLLVANNGLRAIQELRHLEWPDACESVWMRVWLGIAMHGLPVLREVPPQRLPQLVRDGDMLVEQFNGIENTKAMNSAQRIETARAVFASALVVALRQNGWTVMAMPGDMVRCQHGDVTIEPLQLVKQMVDGVLSDQAWRDDCLRMGIERLDIGAAIEAYAAAPEPAG